MKIFNLFTSFLQILTCVFHTERKKKSFSMFFNIFKVAEFVIDLVVLGTQKQPHFAHSRE